MTAALLAAAAQAAVWVALFTIIVALAAATARWADR